MKGKKNYKALWGGGGDLRNIKELVPNRCPRITFNLKIDYF